MEVRGNLLIVDGKLLINGVEVATVNDIGPGFYGSVVKHSDGSASFSGVKVFSFESGNFYLSQNDPNTDEVQINLRGAGVGGVSDHGALTGLSDDDHTQYSLANGTRAFTGHVRMDDTLNVENAVTAEAFYAQDVQMYDGTIQFGREGSENLPNLVGKDADSGIYFFNATAPGIGFTINGNDIFRFIVSSGVPTGEVLSNDVVLLAGSDSWEDHTKPSFGFNADDDTGMFNDGENVIGFAAGGVRVAQIKKQAFSISGSFYSDTFGEAPFKQTETFAAATEWQMTHNLNTKRLGWWAYDTGDRAIIPQVVDVSNPNTIYFYFGGAVAGVAVVMG